MSTPDPSLYIVAAAVIGMCCGFLAASIRVSNRLRRLSAETWREAREYYRRLYSTPNNN